MNARCNHCEAGPRFPRGLALLLLTTALLLAYAGLHKRAENVAPIAAVTPHLAETQPARVIAAQTELRPVNHHAPPDNRQAGAFAAVEANSDRTRESLRAKLAAGVLLADIPAALDELKHAEFLGCEFTQPLLRRWAEADGRAAAAWVEQLPAGAVREGALSGVAIEWANTDMPSAAVWARQLPEESERQATLLTIANEAVRTDPLEALRLTVELPADGKRDETIRRAAMEWTLQDATSAVDWAEQIPDEALRSKVLAAEAIAWADSAPESAATLALKTLPPGRLLDDTVVSIVQRWAQQQPEEAAAWVEQFPPGKLQVAAIENVAAMWRLQDGPTAEAWRSRVSASAAAN